MSRTTKLRMYVDETGSADMGASRNNPNHPFLSLTGVIADLAHVAEVIVPEMEQLKAEFFWRDPDEAPLILHRKEIVNKSPPFERLRDASLREQFDDRLVELMVRWQYQVITVCIDKQDHLDRYGDLHYHPYHYCIECLMERFSHYLNRRGMRGDLLAECRGGKEDRQLKLEYRRLWEQGTRYCKPAAVQQALTSREIKLKTKQTNVAGLQLADLLAHPSRCELLKEQGLLDRPLAPFARRVVGVLQTKYDRFGARIWGKKML